MCPYPLTGCWGSSHSAESWPTCSPSAWRRRCSDRRWRCPPPPPTYSRSVSDNVHDKQLVSDEHWEIVTIISVFLLSHTLGGFFHDLCLPPLYILITLPLHHRTSTFPTSRPCTISPSSPCQCPWLELEPPQSGLTVLPVQVQQTVQPVQEQQLSYLCKSRRQCTPNRLCNAGVSVSSDDQNLGEGIRG